MVDFESQALIGGRTNGCDGKFRGYKPPLNQWEAIIETFFTAAASGTMSQTIAQEVTVSHA